MPKLEAKTIHRELEQETLWPVYWLYGPEKLKARELLARIRKTCMSDADPALWSWNEVHLDADQVQPGEILDHAQSLSLGGGIRFLQIRDAHLLKNPEDLAPLLGGPAKKADLSCVCVFIAKDLDGRKKFSKLLTEKAAVVSCDVVLENERQRWVEYLAKRRGIPLDAGVLRLLCCVEPWSLDGVEQELEKISLGGGVSEDGTRLFSSEDFIRNFFDRNLNGSLSWVSIFAEEPSEYLPLLGLLGWNARQLALWITDRDRGTRYLKNNPFTMDQLKTWGQHWTLLDVLDLQRELATMDFSLKQTPLMPLGLWTQLVFRFAR